MTGQGKCSMWLRYYPSFLGLFYVGIMLSNLSENCHVGLYYLNCIFCLLSLSSLRLN